MNLNHVRNPGLRRSALSVARSNLAFGPGGQISVVSASVQDTLPSEVLGQNLGIPTPSPILLSTPSQPLEPTTNSILGNANTPLGSSVVTSISSPFLAPSYSVSSPSLSLATSMSVLTLSPTSSIPETSPVPSATAALPVSPSPSPSPPVANSGHGASFYVGIVVGLIIIIACLTALVAWWIRMRSHARRRRLTDEAAAGVPWAEPENSRSLEDAQQTTFIGSGNLAALGPMAPSSQNPMAWEPRGDRDVGEPKRTNSFFNAPVFPTKRSATPYDPFAIQYPDLANSTALPLSLPLYETYSKMQLPTSHLHTPSPDVSGTVDDHGGLSALGPLQVANRLPGDMSVVTSRAPSMLGVSDDPPEFGTPMVSMAGSRPRFLGLEGGGLRVPWTQTAPSFPRGVSFTRKRGVSGVGNWEHLPPLQTSGNHDSRGAADPDGWTVSLKTNLMNAFNAVAAGLPSAPTMEEQQTDYLTPRPARRTSYREPPNPADQDQMFVRGLTRDSSVSSKPWSLEERQDGTGTVHFHGLEGYRGADHAFSPLPADSRLTLQDGGQADIGETIFRMTTHDSQTPLIVNRKPKTALLGPGFCGRRISQYGYSRKPALVSRASSVYSTMSATSSVYGNAILSGKRPESRRESVLSRNSTRTSGISPPSSEGRTGGRRFIGGAQFPSSSRSLTSQTGR